MFRICHALRTTKLIPIKNDRQVILVGILREKLFGPDTIEEALKVVDSVSLKSKTEMTVFVGINDQEFTLIQKSVRSATNLKGKFMSPLIALCAKYNITVSPIGRKLTATSSQLSRICFENPPQFYRLLWLLSTKSLSQLRSPQARPFLDRHIPLIATKYFDDGSDCMSLKIIQGLNDSESNSIIAVVPMENVPRIQKNLEHLEDVEELVFPKTMDILENEDLGLWIPVLVLYVFMPLYLVYEAICSVAAAEVTEMANFETQGLALGTWVRDKRRD